MAALDTTFRQIAKRLRTTDRRLARLERWDIDDYTVGVNAGTMDDFDNTGATDVRAAFEEAIENLADDGGKLELPAGTYRMDSGLAITKRVKIIGEGKNRTIINVNFDGADLFTLTGRGSRISGITFQATVSRASAHFILLNASDITIDDCDFLDYYAGIGMTEACGACIIRECLFQTNVVANNGFAVTLNGTKNKIRNCTFRGVLSGSATLAASYPHDAIIIGAGGGAWGCSVKDCLIEKHRHGVRVRRCGSETTSVEDVRLYQMGLYQVLVQPDAGQFVDHLKLIKVTAEDAQAANAHGLFIEGATGSGVRNVTLRDCEMTSATGGSVGAWVQGTNVEDVLFVGGRYNANNSHGIYIPSYSATSQVKVHGVRARNNGGYGARFGAGVIYDIKNCEFGGNASGGIFDDDTGIVGGKGKKRKKQAAGNYPDRNNDEFDGLELMDDGTDQTAILQAIIDALPANGGAIRLPEGSFHIVGPVNVNKAVRFIGKGRAATRLVAAHATNNVFYVTAAQCVFRDLSIRTAVTRTAGAGIFFESAAHFGIVQDCFIEDQEGAVTATSNSCHLREVQVETSRSGIQFYLDGAEHEVVKCRLVQISGSRVGQGIAIGNTENGGSEVKVRGCKIQSFDVGIAIRRSENGLSISDCVIRNCNTGWFIQPSTGITNNGTKISQVDIFGAQLRGGQIDRSGGGTISNLTVSNNIVTGGGCSVAGFYILGSAGTIRNVTLRGCKVESITGDGFFVNAAISDWKITDCVARSCTGWGCRIIAGNTAYTVSNNRFKNNTAGNFQDLSKSKDRQGRANDPDGDTDVPNITPKCRIYRNTDQSIPNNTWTEVLFTAEDHDEDGMHSTVSNTGQVVIRTAGRYTVRFEGRFESNNEGGRFVRIRRTRSAVTINLCNDQTDPVPGGPTRVWSQVKRHFQENDIVTVEVLQDRASGSLNLEYADDISPYFDYEKLD